MSGECCHRNLLQPGTYILVILEPRRLSLLYAYVGQQALFSNVCQVRYLSIQHVSLHPACNVPWDVPRFEANSAQKPRWEGKPTGPLPALRSPYTAWTYRLPSTANHIYLLVVRCSRLFIPAFPSSEQFCSDIVPVLLSRDAPSQTVMAERTSSSTIDGSVLPDGKGRKVRSMTVDDDRPDEPLRDI